MVNPTFTSIIRSSIITFLILFVLLPLSILILIPLSLLRIFAILTSKCHPELGRILSLSSSIFATDDLYSNPSCTLVAILTLERPLDFSTFENQFKSILNSNIYPELQQCLSRWMGFYFWKNSPNFCLENHLHFIPNKTLNPETKLIEREKLVKKPFKKGSPLWEVVLYPNYTGDEMGTSLIMFRVHHSLVDGYSILNLCSKFADSKSIPTAKPNYKNRSFLSQILFKLKLITLGPLEVIKSISDSKDMNEWKVPPEKVLKICHKCEQRISLDFVKDVAKMHSAKTSAVIFAALTGGIRNYMVESGSKIPEHLTIICPLPIPRHPDRLTNHATIVPIRAPVSEPNSIKRLQKIQSTFKSLENSTLLYGFASLLQIVGLISAITQHRRESALGTGIMTNFPGPQVTMSFSGIKISDIGFAAGLQSNGLAVGFSAISYDGQLLFAVKADQSLFPDGQSTASILKHVIEEFHILASNSEQLV